MRRAVDWGSPLFPGSVHEIEPVKQSLDEHHQLWAATRDDEPAGLVLPRVVVIADSVEEARRLALPGLRTMMETYESWGLPVDFGPILRDWNLIDKFAIIGDEEYCAERLQVYRDLGTTDLMAQMALPGVETAVSDETLHRLAKLTCAPNAAV
jgi:alkanesulfonate monooxygenase SsuD/methylene tetrahydromethanopterin reductase-like flavin-dependent oxidoreductase (luciferase family)